MKNSNLTEMLRKLLAEGERTFVSGFQCDDDPDENREVIEKSKETLKTKDS